MSGNARPLATAIATWCAFGVALNCCSVSSIVDPLLTALWVRAGSPFRVREPRANRIDEGFLRERFTKERDRSGGEPLSLRHRILVRADEDHRELALRGQELPLKIHTAHPG